MSYSSVRGPDSKLPMFKYAAEGLRILKSADRCMIEQLYLFHKVLRLLSSYHELEKTEKNYSAINYFLRAKAMCPKVCSQKIYPTKFSGRYYFKGYL